MGPKIRPTCRNPPRGGMDLRETRLLEGEEPLLRADAGWRGMEGSGAERVQAANAHIPDPGSYPVKSWAFLLKTTSE